MARKYKNVKQIRLPGRVWLCDTTRVAVAETIRRYHYSRTVPAAPLNVYWIMAGRRPIGAVTLGVGSGATRVGVPRRLFGRRIHHRQWRTVERLVLFPRWNGGNVISQMFSVLFRLAALSGWRFLHTVADERAGNGAGYRASNFVPVRCWTSECFGDLGRTKFRELGVIHKVAYQAYVARAGRGSFPKSGRSKLLYELFEATGERGFEKAIGAVGGRILKVKQYEYVRVIDTDLDFV